MGGAGGGDGGAGGADGGEAVVDLWVAAGLSDHFGPLFTSVTLRGRHNCPSLLQYLTTPHPHCLPSLTTHR